MFGLSLSDAADLGTALAPIAVIVGAIAAALYARSNHKEQLQQALRSQDQRLNHDRHMQDRSALRQVLDEVGRDVTDAFDAVSNAHNRIVYLAENHRSTLVQLHDPPDPLPELTDEEEDEAFLALEAERLAIDAFEQARRAVMKVGPNQFRLRLRLEDEDAICDAHWQMRRLLVDWSLGFDVGSLPPPATDLSDLNARLKSAGKALDGFVDACRAWFKANPTTAGT